MSLPPVEADVWTGRPGMAKRDAFPLRAAGQRCAAAGRTVREERCVLWLLAVRTREPIGRAANPEKRFRFKWVGTKKTTEQSRWRRC